MFKNKQKDGRLNRCGLQVRHLRKMMGISQRQVADGLQLLDLDVGKNAVQQIESGERFVTDTELYVLARFFRVSADELLCYDEL